jgi:hypothetical protein
MHFTLIKALAYYRDGSEARAIEIGSLLDR